jgi:hypothetical protein
MRAFYQRPPPAPIVPAYTSLVTRDRDFRHFAAAVDLPLL